MPRGVFVIFKPQNEPSTQPKKFREWNPRYRLTFLCLYEYLHDVGFMYGSDRAATVVSGIVKGKVSHPVGRVFCYKFNTLYNSGHNLVLNTCKDANWALLLPAK